MKKKTQQKTRFRKRNQKTENRSKKSEDRKQKPWEIRKRVMIMDTTLRDAHQSLLATRLKTKDMLPIAEKIDKIGYWSVEMWGGATFDSALRFLREDPWERIRLLKKQCQIRLSRCFCADRILSGTGIMQMML